VKPSLASRPVGALLAAAIGAAAMAVLWAATFHVGALTRVDGHAMEGFAALHDAFGDLSGPIVHAFEPVSLALASAVLVGTALLRRRPRQAMGAAMVLVGANVTAQALKSALAASRGFDIQPDSWPSGHATAAMSLALSLVLVVPLGWRPLAGAAAAVFALVVGVAILITGGHFPSDVLGGFLLAAVWMALALAAMRALPARPPVATGPGPRPREVLKPTTVALAIVTGLTAIGLLARASAVVDHVEEHPAVVLGGIALAVAAIALAGATALALTTHGPDTR
jgi:membrane-associated phospholipid phosphatase